MENNDKFTKRDAKADTQDIPDLTASEELAEERQRRAMSYRERQRLESERKKAAAQTEDEWDNPFGESAPAVPVAQRRSADSFDRELNAYREAYSERQKAKETGTLTPAAKAAKKKKKKKKSVAYRVVCGILGTLIGLVLVFSGFAAYYIVKLDLNQVDIDKNNSGNLDSQYTQYYEDENGEEIRVVDTIYEGQETDSFKEAIKEWKNSGNAYLQSNKVINVLLVGIDRNEDGSQGRSDTMILASLNLNTKTITLSSFYRDCWMYETFDNDTRSAWAKLNAAFVYGNGADGLISNIEDYYKIHIDHFVGVDFQSFQDIVDAVGGVTVPLQDYEAAFIREQLGSSSVQPGDAVKLNGMEALWYVRMRHTDSDGEVSRTRRQRLFISALIDEFKSTSLTELDSVVTSLFKYVQTDMSKAEIIKYGTRALLGKWYNYDIQQQQVPDEPYRMDYWGSTWVWLVDYPGAAYAMQMNIYGYSNIVLNENRYTMLDIARDLINAGYQLV